MNSFEKWWSGVERGLIAAGYGNPQVLAALEAVANSVWVVAQPKWQPIETAPIGIWCLFLDGRGTMEAAIYGHAVHVDKVLQKSDNEPIHETFYNYYHNYTHWMPLPEAPQEDE